MSLGLDIRPAANVDVDDIARYIRSGSVDASFRFYDVAYKTFRMLAEEPGMGPAVRASGLRGLRKWAIHGFLNYIVFYRVHADHLEIVRVLHGARNVYRILRSEP